MNAKIVFSPSCASVAYSKCLEPTGKKKRMYVLISTIDSSPITYWLFTYVFDLILSAVWFAYLLAIYCLIEIIFNGTAKNSPPENYVLLLLQFATEWDLRVQFYPLTILIALPTLPWNYLLCKVFKSDILVKPQSTLILLSNHVLLLGRPQHLSPSCPFAYYWYYCSSCHIAYRQKIPSNLTLLVAQCSNTNNQCSGDHYLSVSQEKSNMQKAFIKW